MEISLQLVSVMQFMTGMEQEDQVEKYKISQVIVWVQENGKVQVCVLVIVMHEGMTLNDTANEQK